MTEEVEPVASRLGNFPVSFFSIIMGLSGLVIATQKIENLLESTDLPSTVLLALTLAVLLVLTVVYALKLVRYRPACAQEFNDPVKLSFFPAFSISLLLVAVAFLPISKTASLVFWTIGAVLHLLLTLIILSIWVQQQKFEIKHMSPVWFIPVVGNILVPVAGVEHAPDEISWFFFSVGLVFWMILQTLFFYRIFFHHPLPEKLLPTFFILLAPPVVGAIAYVKLTGELDSFANILYYYGLFIFLFLLVQIGMLPKARFYLSWWAYSFPVAALTIASTMMHAQTDLLFYRVLALVVFAILVVLICLLAVLTIANVVRARICVEE
ncbi:MAG: SLAC1 anion channel family protein [Thermoleophilia bacterium]|nr:SLAC1 anion channel family protein [Thermoleophilia bacterium]